jgi:tripartite-type tricarboxylate transporter receptor subunit TctC
MAALHHTANPANIRKSGGVMDKPLSCIAFTLLVLGASAQAQDAGYPNRPIRVIVPVAAGAGIDTAARVTAAAAEPHLGGKFVIENKPGASQRLGSSMVAKSAPDGYTLLFTSPSPIVVTQFFPPALDFDPEQDLRPLMIGMFQPVLLIVRPNLGVKTVDEFVAHAKKNPGKLSFGVQGLFGEMRMTLENFKKTAGIDVTHVPYNSGAQAIVDLLSDRLDAMFLVIPPIKQHVQNGKLVALATLNATRVEALPGIPTMKELRRAEMTSAIWFGYLAPARTPDAIVAKLVQAFQALKADRALSDRVTEMGAELSLTGPAEFGKIIADDRRRYGQLVAEGKLDKQN